MSMTQPVIVLCTNEVSHEIKVVEICDRYMYSVCIGLNVYTYYDLRRFGKSVDYKPINSRNDGGQQYQDSNPVSPERQEDVFHDQHTLADKQKAMMCP